MWCFANTAQVVKHMIKGYKKNSSQLTIFVLKNDYKNNWHSLWILLNEKYTKMNVWSTTILNLSNNNLWSAEIIRKKVGQAENVIWYMKEYPWTVSVSLRFYKVFDKSYLYHHFIDYSESRKMNSLLETLSLSLMIIFDSLRHVCLLKTMKNNVWSSWLVLTILLFDQQSNLALRNGYYLMIYFTEI